MKTVDLAADDRRLRVEPEPSIKPLVRQVWRDLLASSRERTRLANDLAKALGPWWQVSWREDYLVAQRQSVRPAGTAFGMPAPTGPALGLPKVICDGEYICAERESEDENLNEDLAYVMAKIAKYLNWHRVVFHGSAPFQNRFRRHALHETDFYTWAFEMAQDLRNQRPANIDWDGIAEELEDLGISQERAFESHMRVLLAHLLKWAYDPGHRSKSWKLTIENNRDELKDILERNPGLRQRIPLLFNASYRKVRREAANESSLDESYFPNPCPWPYDEVMAATFWPDASTGAPA